MNTTSPTEDPIGLRERSALYRLLALLFRDAIEAELAHRLATSGTLDVLATEGYDLERDALTDPEQLAHLRREFTRVFCGPGPHVAPYGSVHHPDDDSGGQLWGMTTSRLYRFAADHGLAFEGKAYDGIPDHIAHELALLARLLDARADALEADELDRAERIHNSEGYLLREDLCRWVPAFCRRVREVARRPLYAEVARLTEDLLVAEHELHDEATA